MTPAELLQAIDELTDYLAALRVCVVMRKVNMDGAAVSESDRKWRQLHALDGPVEEWTARFPRKKQ